MQVAHRSEPIGDRGVDPHVGFDDATAGYREMARSRARIRSACSGSHRSSSIRHRHLHGGLDEEAPAQGREAGAIIWRTRFGEKGQQRGPSK